MLAEQLRNDWDSAVLRLTCVDNGQADALDSGPADPGMGDVTVIEFTRAYAKRCNSLLSYV